MKALQFTPVMYDAARAEPQPLSIRESPQGMSYELRLEGDGRWTATPIGHGSDSSPPKSPKEPGIALLRHCPDLRSSAWVFVACANGFTLNGSEPLPAAVLEPGSLLAFGDHTCQICSLWQPEQVTAPTELRDKPCPVCGAELGCAPVVQCGCGRWTHLEKPSAPNDKDALNCFTAAGTCGGCGRRAVLEPQMFPDVSDRLSGHGGDDAEFDW